MKKILFVFLILFCSNVYGIELESENSSIAQWYYNLDTFNTPLNESEKSYLLCEFNYYANLVTHETDVQVNVRLNYGISVVFDDNDDLFDFGLLSYKEFCDLCKEFEYLNDIITNKEKNTKIKDYSSRIIGKVKDIEYAMYYSEDDNYFVLELGWSNENYVDRYFYGADLPSLFNGFKEMFAKHNELFSLFKKSIIE